MTVRKYLGGCKEAKDMNKILMILVGVMMGCGGVTGPSEPSPTLFDYGWLESPTQYPIYCLFSVPELGGEWGIATNLENFWTGEFEMVDGISSNYDIYFHHEYCEETHKGVLWVTYTGKNDFTIQIKRSTFQIKFPCDNWIVPIRQFDGPWEYVPGKLTYSMYIGYPWQSN